jgi:predicted metal-binding protein
MSIQKDYEIRMREVEGNIIEAASEKLREMNADEKNQFTELMVILYKEAFHAGMSFAAKRITDSAMEVMKCSTEFRYFAEKMDNALKNVQPE